MWFKRRKEHRSGASRPPTGWPAGVKLLRTLEGDERAVTSVAFAPQGGTLASNGKTIKLWEAGSEKLVRTLDGYQGQVYGVAFDPQGRTLASVHSDGTVQLWDA